jgi:beta-exotoxin I transport system permease protein
LQFGALALLVGAATGHVAASRALPALIAVVAYLVKAFAPLVSWLSPRRRPSPFYLYIGHDPLRTGFSVAGIAVGVATTAVLVGLAIAAFGRRDVRT